MGPIPVTISRSGRCPLRTTSRCPSSSRRPLWNWMSVDYLVFDRGLQQLACSFLKNLSKNRLLFIFCSLLERDHFILWHWCIFFFWRPRARPPLVSFLTERMRLSLPPHPQLSVIPPEFPSVTSQYLCYNYD